MAKRRIIWTKTAKSDRKEILEYWIKRNKSKTYSRKLNKLFNESVHLIAELPNIGRLTNDKKARIKIVRDYLIFYEYTQKELTVLSIWDSRRDEKESGYDYVIK